MKFQPMLSTLSKEPFDSTEWIFELKWDGFRCVSTVEQGNVQLTSKKGLQLSFPIISQELRKCCSHDIIMDGEIIVFNDQGYSDFDALMANRKHPKLAYMVFDLIAYKGKSIINKPLIWRKEMLKNVLPMSERIRYVDFIEGAGISFFSLCQLHDLEGMIAKKRDSLYCSGQSEEWLKIKNPVYCERVGMRQRFKKKEEV